MENINKEESLLCLVDKSWDEISNKKAYDYKSKNLFTWKIKMNLFKLTTDENKTLIKINDENTKDYQSH